MSWPRPSSVSSSTSGRALNLSERSRGESHEVPASLARQGGGASLGYFGHSLHGRHQRHGPHHRALSRRTRGWQRRPRRAAEGARSHSHDARQLRPSAGRVSRTLDSKGRRRGRRKQSDQIPRPADRRGRIHAQRVGVQHDLDRDAEFRRKQRGLGRCLSRRVQSRRDRMRADRFDDRDTGRLGRGRHRHMDSRHVQFRIRELHAGSGQGGRLQSDGRRRFRRRHVVRLRHHDLSGMGPAGDPGPGDLGEPDLRPHDDGGWRDGDVHGGARESADGERDDRALVERPDRGDGGTRLADVHAGELEHGADRDRDGRERLRRRRQRGLHDRDGGRDQHGPWLQREEHARRGDDRHGRRHRGDHGKPDLRTDHNGRERRVTATFTVALTSQTTANLTIGLTSFPYTALFRSPASLTFTPASWNTAQTVTVTGVDDFVADGAVAYTIVTAAATSTDPGYNGMDPADVAATNTDNDTAGITVSPTSGLTTTEGGGTATFTMALTSQPTANVTIGLSSSDLTEGTVAPASVPFTTVNRSTAQTVTVTGVDDFAVDGNVAYTIVTAAATSTDG